MLKKELLDFNHHNCYSFGPTVLLPMEGFHDLYQGRRLLARLDPALDVSQTKP